MKKRIYSISFIFILLFFGFSSNPAGAFFPFLDNQAKDETIHVDLIRQIIRSLSIIDQNYYDPSRVNSQKMLEEGLYSLSKKVPELLIIFPEAGKPLFKVSLGDKTKTFEYEIPQKLFDIIGPVSDVFSFISTHYKGDVKLTDMEYAVITGLLKPLDPHSNILTPEVFKEFQTQTSGEYGGIGIVIGLKEDDLTVISPIDDTPAAKAGVKAEDKILEIDRLPTINMPLSEAVERLRGKVGTQVLLKFSRKNKDPWETTLIRKKINIQSVSSKLVQIDGKNMGVIVVKSFQEDTFHDMDQALQKLKTNTHLSGLILDLRNNPGGLLDQSIDVADRFLDSGDIVITVGAGDQEEKARATHDPLDDTTTPLIVLVNEGSASASEIVSGALKNNNRALIVGAQTFGKGSVQSLFSLREGASVKLTIAQYLTPGKESIQAVGITPDIRLHPMLISEDGFDIWDDKPFGEINLDEHLENTKYTKVSKPTYNLSYLLQEKKEQESQYTSKIDEKNDYALNFATRILTQLTSKSRPEMVSKSKSIVDAEDKMQDIAITMALGKKNINWSKMETPEDVKTQLEVASIFTDKATGKEVTTFTGGNEYNWTLTITNKTGEDINRVIGVVDSENPLVNQKEFVFGKIVKSQTLKSTIHFKVTDDIINFDETAKINLIADGKQFQEAKFDTHFREKSKPNLAYQINFKDNGEGGSHGNGNGIPEKGETVALDVSIKNISANAAGDVIVNLTNEEGDGIYLKTGRYDLGEIKPNTDKIAALSFSIGSDFARDKMKLTLTAFDKDTRAGFKDEIKLSLGAPLASNIEPPVNSLQVLPDITISENKIESGGKSLLISGSASDDQKLKDIIIYAGGKKIYYNNTGDSSSSKSLNFSVHVPLVDGANIISIEARDNRDLFLIKNMSVIGQNTGLSADANSNPLTNGEN